jgi:nucleotide-binding universal stress UspA family protein
MGMRRILVGLDGSPLAETTLHFVEMLAKRVDARVTLLHVTRLPEDAAAEEVVRQATRLAQDYLADQQRRLGAAGIDATIAVVPGNAAREIVAYASREGCDLIALATHGRSGLARWAHGSVTDEVLRTTTIPLLLVRPGDGWAAAPRAINRILVPLDGSPEAEAALAVAEPLARACNVPVVLVRFVEPVLIDLAGDPTGTAAVDFHGIVDSLVDAAREYLDRTAAAVGRRGVIATTEVSVGQPADGIAAHTHRRPDDLVVLGTHGASGWRRYLPGSVARRVIRTVAVPTIVCPPRRAQASAP